MLIRHSGRRTESGSRGCVTSIDEQAKPYGSLETAFSGGQPSNCHGLTSESRPD